MRVKSDRHLVVHLQVHLYPTELPNALCMLSFPRALLLLS